MVCEKGMLCKNGKYEQAIDAYGSVENKPAFLSCILTLGTIILNKVALAIYSYEKA
jgi:hypothetical protein